MAENLDSLVSLIADGIKELDRTLPPFKQFQAGIGPYGEPQLAKSLVSWMNISDTVPWDNARTKREPDILIPGNWAIELKLARPFGDNGKEAEHWSQNLLHPYPGNVSSLADALKLMQHDGPESCAVVVIGYEHDPCMIDLEPLFRTFEVTAHTVLEISLSGRSERRVTNLRHPIHKVSRVCGWEVIRAP